MRIICTRKLRIICTPTNFVSYARKNCVLYARQTHGIIWTPKSIFAYQYHELAVLFCVLFIHIFMRPGSSSMIVYKKLIPLPVQQKLGHHNSGFSQTNLSTLRCCTNVCIVFCLRLSLCFLASEVFSFFCLTVTESPFVSTAKPW